MRSVLKTLVTGAALVFPISHAFTTFQTDCSLPTESVTYVSSPNVRGVLDLLWTSLAVLIACAYTVLHTNIPRHPEHIPHPGRRIKGEVTKKKIQELSDIHMTALWWLKHERPIVATTFTFFVMLAPEFIYAIAIAQFINAKVQLKLLRSRLSREEGDEWKLAHMYFADMGGMTLLHRAPVQMSWPNPKVASTEFIQNGFNFNIDEEKAMEVWEAVQSAQDFTHASTFESSSKPRYYYDVESPTKNKLEPSFSVDDALDMTQYLRFHLDAFVLRRAIEQGLLPSRPPPLKSIEDRSKSDVLAKSLVMLQLIAFGINLIARMAENLPVSALEIATAPFALSSFVIYALFINKPRDVSTPIVLGTYDKLPLEILEIKVRNRYFGKYVQNSEVVAGPLPKKSYINSGVPFHPMEVRPSAESLMYGRFAFLAIGLLFGVVHLAAWDISFPTPTDAALWRGSAVVTGVLPILGAVLPWVTLTDAMASKTFAQAKFMIPFLFGCGIYFLARTVLLVEVFRGLFFLPPNAYRVPNWSWNIPHFT